MSSWVNFESVRRVARIIVSSCIVTYLGTRMYKYFLDKSEQRTVIGSIIENHKESFRSDNESSIGTMSSTEDDSDNESNASAKDTAIVDIEDVVSSSIVTSKKQNISEEVFISRKKFKKAHNTSTEFTEQQLSDKLRLDLSKQGYGLIGSHSAVKICRWTKNSMRGRGGCYKHTFYGIKSYQCMEMTPNLACASKCTFCWRHHKNPVGTEWKWKMDSPEMIVEQGLKSHCDMIKQLKGVPGVKPERFQEAQTVRHCALSLVGEPVFYPRINELLTLLHSKNISTFLVTNAQFPEEMRELIPVTQLYVSIDAPNKTALKKIDRPLYKDFWERYIECLRIIKEKKQRTVFRLTLVQKGNMEDLEGYSRLIGVGCPDFIEIKGVTYCGTSKANKLTMDNVPWHEQVVEFAQELVALIPGNQYELACEHSHSNCVLIANKKFLIDGTWHIWIDYSKFFQFMKQGDKDFSSLDYAMESPPWAIFGSKEAGFDPEHIRWIRKDHKLKLLKERLQKIVPI